MISVRIFVCVLALFASILSFASEDRSIWLQPGQCVLIGGQQVCAQRAPDGTTPGNGSTAAVQPNKQTHVCKNGIKDEANPNLKGWAHVVITRSPDGKKLSEDVEKTYGPLGKADCLVDVEKAKQN